MMLTALVVRVVSGLGPVDQDPSQIHDDACEIIDTCFKPRRPPDPPNASFDLSFLGWIVIIALLGAIVYGVVRAWMGYAGRPAKNDDGDGADHDVTTVGLERIIDRTREPDVWRDEAERLAGEGRFREAMRCRYRALVGDLARANLLDEIPGRTTGEERAQLRDTQSPAFPAFAEATRRFDEVWYNASPVDEAAYRQFIELENDVLVSTGTTKAARR